MSYQRNNQKIWEIQSVQDTNVTIELQGKLNMHKLRT